MRIAIFIKRTTLHANFGGLETQNKLLSEGLVKRGHSVCVFSPCWEIEAESKIENGVTYYFIDSPYKLSTKAWIEKSQEVFSEIHKRNRFDIVLSQSSAGIGVIKNKNEFGVKVVSISHGTILGEYKTRLQSLSGVKDFLNPLFAIQFAKDTAYVLLNFFTRQREFILNSNRVIAVSNAVKRELINETYIPEDRVAVIFNGVSLDGFDSTPSIISSKDSSKTKFIYVGRVVKSKGLFNLIESLDALYTLDFVLDIVGTGEDLDALRKHVAATRITNKVNFLGHVSYDLVLKQMAAHDVFILPSIRVEGFPMVLVEAMLSNLCVVASDIGGISDAISDNETGILVKPGNITMLSEKLALVATNVELRQRLATNARIKAQKDFSIEVMLNKYEDLLRGELSL